MPRSRAAEGHPGVYMNMWLRVLLLSTLVTALYAGTPADRHHQGSCGVTLLGWMRDPSLRDFSMQEHETYRHTPVVHYAIDSQGKVLDVRLVRSSGIRRLDATILNAIKHWRYKPDPHCPLVEVVETDASITIDWF